MVLYDDLKSVASSDGPLATLSTEQAAGLLGMTVSALEKQREADRQNPDSEHMVPFHYAGKRVVYYLMELLAHQAKGPFGLPMPSRGLAILMGEDVCRELGVRYPNNPAQALRKPPESAHISQNPVSMATLINGISAEPEKVGRKTGPKSLKADQERARQLKKLGVNVTRNLCRFGSMVDFLRRAEPKDEWLFCCPPNERPFDFMDAVLEGNPNPFVWLTLEKYLDKERVESKRTRDIRVADEEAMELTTFDPSVANPLDIDSV